jgi:glucuronosyltransferase
MIFAIKYFVTFAAIGVASGGNILYLNGMTSPSHHLWSRVLIKGLVEKGHNVTMVSVDDDPSPSPNIHYIFLEAGYKTIYGGAKPFDLIEMANQKATEAIQGVYDWCELNCDGIIASKGLDIILNYPNDFKFDVVIHDYTCSPCLLPLIHKFNYPPLVSVTAFSNPPGTPHLTGGQIYSSFVPHYVTNYPQVMSFAQRAHNIYLHAVDA